MVKVTLATRMVGLRPNLSAKYPPTSAKTKAAPTVAETITSCHPSLRRKSWKGKGRRGKKKLLPDPHLLSPSPFSSPS